MEIRATRSADLPRLYEIFRCAIDELVGRHGLGAPAPPLEVFSAQQQHLLDHDGERCAVATSQGEPIGYGFDRRLDHAHWTRAAERTLRLRAGRAVAYSYRFPDGTIGPVAGASGRAAGDALAAELRRADGGSVRVRIPGSSRELVAAALGAGLRLDAPPSLLLLGPGVEPPRALAVASYTLL